jgi:hypothetical protein
MKRLRGALTIALLLILAVFLYIASHSIATTRRSNMDPLPPKLQSMFAKTKTVCVGRYLIDVPVSAEVVYGPARVDFDLIRLIDKAQGFPELIAARLAEVENERDFAYGPLKTKDSLVGKVIDGAVPGQKVVFGVGKATGDFYNLHSYLKVGRDVYVQEATTPPEAEEYEKSIRIFNMVAKVLRPRGNDEIPSESGFCMDGAIALDTPEPLIEAVTLGVRLKEVPDVHFSISMTAKDVLVESDALEPRFVQAEEDARQEGFGGWFSRIKMLRRGRREIDGWTGYEILAHKPAQKAEGESHEFVFLSQGEPKNVYRPLLDIQLNTGVKDDQTGARPPSVTDDEAVAIWDRIVGSIRVRPTGAAKPVGTTPATDKPVGTLGAAGETCPQSGWWQCTDGRGKVDVSGGRTQYFRVGEQLPQALLLLPQSLWQKTRGEQATFQSKIPSSWKLADRRKNPRSAPAKLLAAAGPRSTDVAPSINRDGLVIGLTLASGAPCAASGWWRCNEPGSLDGSRWFAEGEILPPASKAVELTVLEKMKGAAPVVRAPANWELVRISALAPSSKESTTMAPDVTDSGTDRNAKGA